MVKRANVTAVLFLCFLFLFSSASFFGDTAYAGWKFLTALSTRRHYRDWQALETSHFRLRYTEADEQLAPWLGREADQAAKEVSTILQHQQTVKPWLVISPDQGTLREVFGWGEGTGALGVYVAETIIILSPQAWEWEVPAQRQAVFAEQGPLVHEYTHYVLDARAQGNYTRWFSEGLAQYVEYRVNGYEWIEASSSLANPHYTKQELEQYFDQLPNQALAYRQAFSMVSYLVELQGEAGLNKMIDLLGQGTPFYDALRQNYGLEQLDFIAGWRSWVQKGVRWYEIKG